MASRFRLFAGPNGSGKTSLFTYLKQQGIIHTELYVNADRYERELKANGSFSFNAYRVKVSQQEFLDHIQTSGLFSKLPDASFINSLEIRSGVLHLGIPTEEINSYHASFVASYLVEKLLETGQSFCFETVMSHQSKVDLLAKAASMKFKTYLYFVYTESPELNITRVKLRAAMGEHDVDEDTIRKRYARTFSLLPQALKIASEAYIIDNVSDFEIVAEKKRSSLEINRQLPTFLNDLLS